MLTSLPLKKEQGQKKNRFFYTHSCIHLTWAHHNTNERSFCAYKLTLKNRVLLGILTFSHPPIHSPHLGLNHNTNERQICCYRLTLKKRVLLERQKTSATYSCPLVYSPYLGPHHNTNEKQLCAQNLLLKQFYVFTLSFKKRILLGTRKYAKIFTPTHVFTSLSLHHNTNERQFTKISTPTRAFTSLMLHHNTNERQFYAYKLTLNKSLTRVRKNSPSPNLGPTIKYLLLRKELLKNFTTFHTRSSYIYLTQAPTITQLKCNYVLARLNPKKGTPIGTKKFPQLISFTQMKAILCL